MAASRLARRDVWSGILMLLAGGAIAVSAVGLGIGALSRPGAGFLGFYVGLAIFLLGGAVLFGALCAADAPSMAHAMAGVGHAPAMLMPMLVFCLMLETVGFLIAGLILMWWLFAVSYGTVRSPKPVLYGIGAVAGVWLLFDRLLGTNLPPLPF